MYLNIIFGLYVLWMIYCKYIFNKEKSKIIIEIGEMFYVYLF